MSLVTDAVLAPGGELLERADALSSLEDAYAASVAGAGRLVLVGGDAGIGKSALVRAFCEREADARVLVGSCDGLRTPRPLGPFLDIARAVGGRFEQVVGAGEPAQTIFEALAAELESTPGTIVLIEDLHWADEATLDVLGVLGRRIERTGALVLATYRRDGLSRAHPLRIVLGDLATTPGVERLQLDPLSSAAVAALAAPHGIDAEDLHAKTAGNPFFVTEILACPADALPATVRDAVLARIARLSPEARRLLDAMAISPRRTELWLLERTTGDDVVALDECLACGIVGEDGTSVAFRHELARLAIEGSISPHRRMLLHRATLAALRTPPDGQLDSARLAHHADAADDGAAVLRFALPAADRASAVGAHREAAAQLERALRYAGIRPLAEYATLLERLSYELYLTDQQIDGIHALEQALACHRAEGDTEREGSALCVLASRRWCTGDIAGAESAAREAVAVLGRLRPGPELARAYAGASAVFMNDERAEEALTWGERALELLDETAPVETLVFQLNNTGTAKLLLGHSDGVEDLERSIALAEASGLDDHVGRGYIHLGWAGTRTRDFSLVDRLETGLEYCAGHGLELWRLYLVILRARAQLDRGRWTEAADAAAYVVRQTNQIAPLLRIFGRTTLGLVRARRGDPDAWALLDEAAELAEGKQLQHIGPVAAARTEAAALAGRREAADQASAAALSLALDRGVPWVAGELAFWRRRAGLAIDGVEGLAEPYALHLGGRFDEAEARWRALGCPYEAALARADRDDVESLHAALAELRALGAGPASELVARRLRELGERGLARGPRPLTRESPAGLTRRETEVLELLATGLRNGEIADRLFVSIRTVDHHVSAVLRKLAVKTRREATVEAVRLGICAQDR